MAPAKHRNDGRSFALLCFFQINTDRARCRVQVHPVFLRDHTPPYEMHPLGQARRPPGARQGSRDTLSCPPRDRLDLWLGCFFVSRWEVEFLLFRRVLDGHRSRGRSSAGRPACHSRPSNCHRDGECSAATVVFTAPLVCCQRLCRREGSTALLPSSRRDQLVYPEYAGRGRGYLKDNGASARGSNCDNSKTYSQSSPLLPCHEEFLLASASAAVLTAGHWGADRFLVNVGLWSAEKEEVLGTKGRGRERGSGNRYGKTSLCRVQPATRLLSGHHRPVLCPLTRILKSVRGVVRPKCIREVGPMVYCCYYYLLLLLPSTAAAAAVDTTSGRSCIHKPHAQPAAHRKLL